MLPVRVLTWPRGDDSVLMAVLDAVLPPGRVRPVAEGYRDEGEADPAPLAEGQRLVVEYEEFPEAVLERYRVEAGSGQSDNGIAFARFASEDWGRFAAFMTEWGDPEAPDGRLVVPRAALRADPGPWLAWASGALDPSLLLTDADLERAVELARGLSAAWQPPEPPAGVGEAVMEQVGRLVLDRETVRSVFYEVLRRNPSDPGILRFQTMESAEALRAALMATPEYRRMAGTSA